MRKVIEIRPDGYLMECLNCGKKFFLEKRYFKKDKSRGRFCSHECRQEYFFKNSPGKYRKTEAAKKKISKNSARYWLGKKRAPVSIETKKKISKKIKRHKQGKFHESKIDGYWFLYRPEHPAAKSKGGYVKRSRLNMEKKLGRFLKSSEIVHHINLDKEDDRIENLMLFSSQRKHLKFHKEL